MVDLAYWMHGDFGDRNNQNKVKTDVNLLHRQFVLMLANRKVVLQRITSEILSTCDLVTECSQSMLQTCVYPISWIIFYCIRHTASKRSLYHWLCCATTVSKG